SVTRRKRRNENMLHIVPRTNNDTLRETSLKPTTDEMLNAFAVFVHIDVAEGDASPDTVRGYFSQVKQFVEWCTFERIEPAHITPADIKRWRQHLIDIGHKPSRSEEHTSELQSRENL